MRIASVDFRIASGKTVLMYAARGASVEIFDKLLELGADPKAADEVRALCASYTCLSARAAVNPLLFTGLSLSLGCSFGRQFLCVQPVEAA